MRYFIPIVAAILLLGCSSSHRDWPRATVVSGGKEELYRNFDSEVTITGKAGTDAKAGVMVVMDDGTRVMIPELKAWPRRIAGMRVSVTGVLHRIPTPAEQSPKPDDQFVLNAVRWEAGSAPKPASTQPK